MIFFGHLYIKLLDLYCKVLEFAYEKRICYKVGDSHSQMGPSRSNEED